MTKMIAIDSSTEACSVALAIGGQSFSRFELAPRRHAELLLPMVDSLLKEADISLVDLDCVACCVGPGAFTGLRIAISIAQGLSYAAKLPCIGVSSLEILAAQAFSETQSNICLASIDARMKEVYFAAYQRGQNGLPEAIMPGQVIPSEKILPSGSLDSLLTSNGQSVKGVAKVGTGWKEYQYCSAIEAIPEMQNPIEYPKAEMMLPLAEYYFNNGKQLKPQSLQPVYLRNNVAKKKSEQK